MASTGEAVFISRESCELMLAHARREAPREACGLLLGEGREVREVVPARNELESATRYRIDARDHFVAMRRARAISLDVIGAFHSHPRSAPVPSATDLEEAWPELLYVIVSPVEPLPSGVRAWRLHGGAFVEIQVVQRLAPARP